MVRNLFESRSLTKSRRRNPRATNRVMQGSHQPRMEALESRAMLAAFTSGNIVLLQVGATGSAAAQTSAATAVFLDEYSPAGVIVQNDLAVPSTGTTALTQSGSAGSEGFLTRSGDGQYLTLVGYRSNAGTASVTGTATTTAMRVVGRVDAAGNIDTSTQLDAYSANNIRSAFTTNGTDIWTGGTATTNGSVRYVTFGNTSGSGTQPVTAPTNVRVVGGFNGQLYGSSSTTGYYGMNAIGTGLPTTTGSTTATALAGTTASGTGNPSPYQFVFKDANTLYVADDRTLANGGGVQKWTFSGSTWSLAYVLKADASAGAVALAGDFSGSNPVLYATVTGGSKAVKITDLGSQAASTFTTFATPPTNTLYKGVAIAPQSASTPTISGAATLTAFITTYGTASAAQSFAVSGSNLTANLVATAPTGFEVSSDGTTYGSTATFTQSGGSASGTLRVRLAATAAVTGSYNAQNIGLSSTGATTVNIATASSGNAVTAKGLTITGITIAAKTYDGTTSATISGSPAYSGLANGESFSVTGTASATFGTPGVGSGKAVTVVGYTAPSANYTVSQPTPTGNVTARSLTVTANNVTKTAGQTLTGGSGSTAFTSSGLAAPGGVAETIGSVTIAYGVGADAGAAVGTYTGQVTPSVATGGTFDPNNYSISYVAGDITVSAAPTISPSGTLSGVTTTYGTPSSATTFTVSGGFLTGNLSVAAPTGFQVSSDGTTYGSSVTLVASSGTVASTTISVRLAAATAVGTYSGNVVISGGGATTQNVAVPASTVSAAVLAITGLSGVSKEYDGGLSASVSGTPAFSGLQNGESFSVSDAITWTYGSKTVGTAKTLVASGPFTAPSANYSVTQPVVTAAITAKPLTVTGAAAASKPFDGTTTASIVGGTLVGVIAGDTVTVGGGGTFAQIAPGTAVAVTAALTLGGADGGNYSLTQPAGLVADITQASQTITFGALASRLPSVGTFTLAATSTSGLAVSYASSNPLVATVSGSTVTIVGPGTTTITASQAGDANYAAAADVTQPFTVMTPLSAGDIAFTGIQTDTTDTFSFVLLRDVVAGTEINFTDNGWSGTALGTAEGIVTATFSGAFTAGSHFVIVGESTKTFSLVGGGSAGSVVVPTSFGLSTSGDSILAYQGAAPTSGSSSSWLAGINTNGGWQSAPTGTNQSALPTALVNGTTAVSFGTETDNGAYNLSTFTGTVAEILGSVNNVANWTLSNTAGPVATTSFTVLRAAPAVSSPAATSVTDTTATLGGTVTSDGGDAITERGIVYAATSANANPLIGGTGVTKLTASGTTGVFSVPVTGLVTATGYSFKAYATNAQGTTYSTVSTFTTAAVPTVSGPTATAVATSSATLGGTVDADGGLPITERGVVYSLTSDSALPAIGAAGVTKIVVSGTTGTFTTPVTALTASSGYSFRAYATNAVGTTYSVVGTFSTPAAATAPVVSSPTVTGVGETTATLGGTVSSDGGATITEIGIVFAPTTVNGDPAIGGAGVTKVTGTGSTGVFTVPVSGLSGATGYSFKAYATNSVGTTYSQVSTFATPASTTIALAGVTPLAATAGSTVTFSGTVVAGSGTATPVGTVEIRVGGASGRLLGSTTTIGGSGVNGTFSIATSAIAIGSYSGIQAFFVPGSGFQASNSGVFGSTLTVSQAAFTPGNLLVLQVGDGTTPITYTSAANNFTGGIALLEFTPTGTLVQSIPVASSGAAALTLRLNSTSEGVLSLSYDRQSVTLGGHRVDVGATNPNTSTTPRVIGKVAPDGTVDTAQAIANVFVNDSIRSVVTDNGTNFWMSGAGTNSSGGIEYVAGPTATTATAVSGLTSPNTRQIQIIDGNLFASSGANTPGRSVWQVGSGMPTTGNQTMTSSVPLSASAQYQSFYFADLDGTASWRNTGFDTLYATDSSSGALVKFSYVVSAGVGSWAARGTLPLTGAGSLVGYASSAGVILYVTSTTGTTGVSTVTDATGYNNDFSALTLSSLATPAVPGANYGFRGISFVPRAGIATTTTVTNVSPVAVEAGSSVTFTATVAAATGSTTPTGAVQFRSGGVLLATAPITGSGATGTATVSTTAIPFGTYANITAQYVPDGNPSVNVFNPSTSAAYSTSLVVSQPGVVTTTTLSSVTWATAPAAAAYGDTITFTGSVATADSTSPVGTVEIRDGGSTGTLLASGSVFGAGGSFTIASTAAIPSGTYANMAAYFVAGSGYKNSNSATSSVSLTISQTTLGLGDIAFTGYQATGTDKISFVLLKDVIAGTTFTLADSAWTGSALASSEGTSTLTLTQAFSAGTVFDFDFARSAGARWQWGSNTANGGSASGIQETTTASFGLNSSGDNLFIYQGAVPTSGTAAGWIAAFSSSSFLTSGVAGTDQTFLPAAFTEGVNAFSLGLAGQAANQNGGLNDLGTVTGSAAGIRTAVYTLGNWTISAGNVAMPSPTVFTVSSATIGTSGSLTALSTVYGTASATTSITVSGSGLSGDVTATAPAGFQVSSDGTSFGGTATFTQASGAVSGTLYVRLAATSAVGTYSGNVTLASSGASSVNAATTSSTVTPAGLTVTANDFSRLYGAANPTFTATITGYVNGENASVLSGAPSLTTAATTTSGIGSYTIAAAAGTLAANAGNYTFTFVDGTLTVLPAGTPVKVTGVYARGSAWNATYLALSPFTTVGSDALGWPLVDGANQVAASSSLTWSNIDTISLQFNQPISQPAAAALKLVLGDNQGDQTIAPSSAPTLLAGGTIAQWSVPALANGKYVISVLSSGISDAGGTTVLDGDWTTGTSTFTQGSGDGTAGGTFNFFFNVLVADVNGSGVVNNTDTTSVRNQLFAAVSAANFRSDFNGSNSINNTDVTALRNKLFGALASYQSPTAPDSVLPSISSPSATSVGASSASLGGTVTSDGGEVVLERGVVLAVTGTNADPVVGGTGTRKIVATGSTGLFNVLASGLLSSTSYSFKAYVRTSKGLTYTTVSTFTTA